MKKLKTRIREKMHFMRLEMGYFFWIMFVALLAILAAAVILKIFNI